MNKSYIVVVATSLASFEEEVSRMINEYGYVLAGGISTIIVIPATEVAPPKLQYYQALVRSSQA